MGRKQCAVLTAALVFAGLTGMPASAAQPSGAPTGEHGTVTLITGDRVSVQGERAASVRMAVGREHIRYWQYQLNGHDYVVPHDAMRLLHQNKLDKRLFDITGLVRQGYDDAREPNVPTIVTGGAGLRGQALNVVDTPKSQAAKAWRDRVAARAAADEKIWLNGRVHATLDQSASQIGAPKAWEAGFRADGVKVAVLDTGYDANHADLKSKVDAKADFTGDGDPGKDPVGHGTHVASTIAGTGDASGGRYKGVAPGARLLVGKVLNSYGGGREDWVINGMRWAVEQGAKVVNMSLGGGATDGTDLMSQAVNELSQASGALFVIAAGNSGAPRSVGTPGAADRALTVANVTKSDQLSVTSSQGPRVGDYGLKPEIAAPGTDIVAARAAGTYTPFSVNEHYTKISGTSMASPHVAGAAAILAGQHPGWTGEQIKNALISSSKRLPGIDTFAQGAGRVDVARGVAQQVRAEGVLGFGELWGKQEASRKVTYTNDSANPVQLTLALDVRRKDGAPTDLFTVDKSVTVPAKGSATVAVAVKATAQPAGEFSGTLRAQSGDTVLTTPLTANVRGDKNTLTVKLSPRQGDPYAALVFLQNEETGVTEVQFTDNGTTTFETSAGRYRVLGLTQDTTFTTTLFAQPVKVEGNTELSVDAKQAKKVDIALDDPEARAQGGGGTAITSDVDGSGPLLGAAVTFGGVPNNLYTLGGQRMRGLHLRSFSYWTQPWTVITADDPGGFEFRNTYAPWNLGFEGRVTARVVDVGEADTESINKAGDVNGAFAIIVPKDWANPVYPPGEQLRSGIKLLKAKGARAVISFFNPTVDSDGTELPVLPTILAFDPKDLMQVQALMQQRTVKLTVNARPNSPAAYFLADSVDGVPNGHEFRFRKDGLGRIERRIIDTLAPDTYRYQFANWSSGDLIAGADVETKFPQRRTDFVSPGAAFQLFGAAGFAESGDVGAELVTPVTLKAGERRTSTMFGAPFGPEFAQPPTSRQDGKPVPAAYREGDRIAVNIPMFADSDPGNASFYDPTNQGSTLLRKDGKEIGKRDDVPGIGEFVVPAGSGRYQLVVDAARQAAIVPDLSTKTRAEWTFHAAPGTARREALPLLDIRFDLQLDDRNTTAAGKPLSGKVTAVHQPGSRPSWIRDVSVEVSFDDGKTWQRAKVSGDRLEIPAGQAGFASLRATARDVHGNSVTETVIHAYAISQG